MKVLSTSALVLAGILGPSGPPALGQVTQTTTTTTITTQPVPDGVQIIVPPLPRHRPWIPQQAPIEVTAINANVTIDEQASSTTLELTLTNKGGAIQEAVMLLPVPDGVAVRSLVYDGVGPEPTAQVLSKDEARRIYDSIVRRVRDPALVEFIGYNLIKTSAFPIPAGRSQKLSLTYEQVLTMDGDRVDFALPRSEALGAADTNWTITADIKSKRPISTVYSPSHEIDTQRLSPNHIRVKLSGKPAAAAGSVRFSYLLEKTSGHGVTATTVAYPDADIKGGDGGYFMLLAGLPATIPEDAAPVKREVVMVLDRSGSMKGDKIKQVVAAAEQIIDGLENGEAFNIIDYSDTVSTFADKPVIKSSKTAHEAKAYLGHIEANGGTNIGDALTEAIRSEPTEGMLPMVIFLTDGRPTVGERSESKIRDMIKATNKAHRRIFSFGVGFDVNTPLLSSLSNASRGASTFVLPDEDVEVKVSQVFRRLKGPVLASPRLVVIGDDGKPDTRAVRELMPAELPDLFDGDQIALMGQYTSDKPVKLRLEGDYLGKPTHFDFDLDVSKASVKNSYVPRIWANRKVASLISTIRESGADGAVKPSDAEMKELVDEIVRLSTKYGILTEYTAFLATESNVHFDSLDGVQRRVEGNLRQRAMGESAPTLSLPGGGGGGGRPAEAAKPARTGAASVNQEQNLSKSLDMKTPAPQSSAPGGAYKDAELQDVQITTVQNVADRTFFQRNNRWIDSALLKTEDEKPDRTVEFGSAEYMTLAEELAKTGRQAALALGGDVLLQVGKERVLVKAP
jgi:Ca-activated chloride channel family protein